MYAWNLYTEDQWDTFSESEYNVFTLDGTSLASGGYLIGSMDSTSALSGEAYVSMLGAGSISSVISPYENLQTDYSIVNINHSSPQFTNFSVSGTFMYNNSQYRLYKYFGDGSFNDHFTHYFNLKLYTGDNNGRCGIWSVSTSNESEEVLVTRRRAALSLEEHARCLVLYSCENNSYVTSPALSLDTDYGIKVVRANTILRCYVYNNTSYSGSPLYSLSVGIPDNRDYHYFMPINKASGDGVGGYYTRLKTWNYNLGIDKTWLATAAMSYNAGGVMASTGTFSNIGMSLTTTNQGVISGVSEWTGLPTVATNEEFLLYIAGTQLASDSHTLYIHGEVANVVGSLNLYITNSPTTNDLDLYIVGEGTTYGYSPFNDYIPLFIGPQRTPDASLWLYCSAPSGSSSGMLDLYINCATTVGSGLDLSIPSVYNTSNNNSKLYIHGY